MCADYVVIQESIIEDLHRANLIEVYNVSDVVHDMMSVYLSIPENTRIETKHHFYWDGGAHYHCWVYSEMNRDLTARYFLNA